MGLLLPTREQALLLNERGFTPKESDYVLIHGAIKEGPQWTSSLDADYFASDKYSVYRVWAGGCAYSDYADRDDTVDRPALTSSGIIHIDPSVAKGPEIQLASHRNPRQVTPKKMTTRMLKTLDSNKEEIGYKKVNEFPAYDKNEKQILEESYTFSYYPGEHVLAPEAYLWDSSYRLTKGRKVENGERVLIEVENTRGFLIPDAETGEEIFLPTYALYRAPYNDAWYASRTFAKNTICSFQEDFEAAMQGGKPPAFVVMQPTRGRR